MSKKKREKNFKNNRKNSHITSELTFAQNLADNVTNFCGSWIFIILIFSFIVVWIFLNAYLLINYRVDPYPFIVLNLILACLTAIEAPIILMSQNRHQERDRIKQERDFIVNRKAERENRKIMRKLDYMRKILKEEK